MANGKLVHYKKIFKITIQGKTDTVHPADPPAPLVSAEELIRLVVQTLDNAYVWRIVTMKEIKR